MSWLLIVISGFVEAAWAIGLTYSHGFTRPVPTVLTLPGLGPKRSEPSEVIETSWRSILEL